MIVGLTAAAAGIGIGLWNWWTGSGGGGGGGGGQSTPRNTFRYSTDIADPGVPKFPLSREGSPVPLIFGRVLIQNANTLWYGDFRHSVRTETREIGDGETQDVPVGYRYYIGFCMSLGLGPDVTLHKIIAEKTVLWTGSIKSGQGTISKSNCFGGSGNGGGWSGDFNFYNGSFQQSEDPYLKNHIPDLPAYIGQSYIVFKHNYYGESSNLKRVAFEVSRYTDILGLGEKAKIGDDINPAEAVAWLLTTDWGGMSMPMDNLYLPSFIATGETLYKEKNGFSYLMSGDIGGRALLDKIMLQIRGYIYHDSTTGLVYLKLTREDYVLENLPLISEEHIIKILSVRKTTWEETYNQIRVNYPSRENSYKEVTAVAQDMANIYTQKRLRTATLSFPGVSNADLANKIAALELSYVSVPTIRIKFSATYEIGKLNPGDVFRFNCKEYGIKDLVLRVVKYTVNSAHNGGLTINCIQDAYAISSTVFAPPELAAYKSIIAEAMAPEDTFIMESPRFFMTMPPSQDTPRPARYIAFATPGNEEQNNYTFTLSDRESLRARYQHSAKLDENVFQYNKAIDIKPPDGFHELHPDFFQKADKQEQRNGQNLILMVGAGKEYVPTNVLEDPSQHVTSSTDPNFLEGHEIISYSDFNIRENGTVRLLDVSRGLLDTTPKNFSRFSKIFFIKDFSTILFLNNEIGAGRKVNYKDKLDAAFTAYGMRDSASVPYSDPIYLRHRARLPYPPAEFSVTGKPIENAKYKAREAITINWKYRSEFKDTISLTEDPADTETYARGESILLYYVYYERGEDTKGWLDVGGVRVSKNRDGSYTGTTRLPNELVAGDKFYFLVRSQRTYPEGTTYPNKVFESMNYAWVKGVIE